MPRKETTETTYYQFGELSDDAKEAAIENTRSGAGFMDYDWWDTTYECFADVCEILGVEVDQQRIFFSGFWSQGDGASFEASYEYAKGWKKKLADTFGGELLEEITAIGDLLQEHQARYMYRLTATTRQRGRGYSQSTDVEHSEGYDFDEAAEDGICEAMNDLASKLYKMLECEYDYQTSDEAVQQSIEANEWEFLEDGTPT